MAHPGGLLSNNAASNAQRGATMNVALYATAMEYGMGVLGITALADYIDIEYKYRKYIGERGTYGITFRRNARLYEVIIATRHNVPIVVDTILHELRHVWQFDRGLLVEDTRNGRDVIIWKEKEVYSSYSNSPHERDACAFAAYYTRKFLAMRGLDG